MSVMDKLINAMKFNDEDDFDEDEEYEEEDYYGDEKAEKQEPVRPARAARAAAADIPEEEEEPAPAPKSRKRFGSTSFTDRNDSSSVSKQVKKQYSEAGMEVCIIKPTSVNDAREVTDTLL
nr:hypothetical protein [Lachnospiraceae bacterium]